MPRWTAALALVLSAGCGSDQGETSRLDGFEQLPVFSSGPVFTWGARDSTDASDSTDANFFHQVVGSRMVVGLGFADELSTVDASGKWNTLYTGAASLGLSDAGRAAVVEALAQELSPDYVRRAAEITGGPTEIPPYEALVADDAGRLWLGDYRDPRSSTRRWRILDQSGTPLAPAVLPARFLATDVRGETIYGYTVDELGIEKVEARRVAGVSTLGS